MIDWAKVADARVTVGVLAVLCACSVVSWWMARKLWREGPERRLLTHFTEMVFTTSTLLVGLLWVMVPTLQELAPWTFGDVIGEIMKNAGYVLAYVPAALLGVLFLTRVISSRPLYILAAGGWIALVVGLCALQTWLPVVREIRADLASVPGSAPLAPRFMLTMAIVQLAKYLVWTIVPFVVGLYVSQPNFTDWKFYAGSFVSGAVISFLMMTVVVAGPTVILLIQPVLFAAIGLLLLKLPLQRAALERLWHGTEAGAGESDNLVRPGLLARLPGQVAVLVAIVACGALAWITQVERKQMRLIMRGPEIGYRVAGEQNAYPILKDLFVKISGKPVKELPEGFKLTSELFARDSETTQVEVSEAQRIELAEAFASISPYIDAVTSASAMDYLHVPVGKGMPHFHPLRETARALALRSMLAAQDGETSAALADIETLISLSGLMKDYPSLVPQMVSVAIRSIAVEAIVVYRLHQRENAEAMRMLLGVLLACEDNLCLKLDLAALRRGEPGLLEVVPNVDIMTPAFIRADQNARMRWLQFQQLTVASALEIFRLERGAYPALLDELVPTYLRILPVDPFEGRRLNYERGETTFTLKPDFRKYKPDEHAIEPLTF